jgi:hypothetical protein
VKIGDSDLTHTIITAGINQDDKIVIGPYKVLDSLGHDKKIKDEKEVEAEKKVKEEKESKDKKEEKPDKSDESKDEEAKT